MIKIPKDLQSLISASYRVNSFKRVVEELVYNSIDAGATSIATRINIQENSIQVIDNGSGIKQNDFNILGQRYTTSKFDNISVVKIIPRTYGCRGLSLASIIDISRQVDIVSRFQDSKETLSKTFCKGESKIVETNTRPSKGTTVEIHGVLCNLKIQKKALELSNELLAIKTLLEQLSLMHVNVSFSLRDDEKNEIIFKIHKNRDIFQTISSLFDITSQELQEIIVEKYKYKVRAFIEKRDIESKKKNWIFLNGKYITKTKVHKIVNKRLSKNYNSRKGPRKVQQSDEVGRNALPAYFLFISCPYSDYDILNSDSNQTLVEFKDWQQITKLLERLVQCYTGDIKLKETGKPKNVNNVYNIENKTNTRDQIKNIIQKMLTKTSKKQSVQMCNAIKGREIKRQRQKKGVTNKLKIVTHKPSQSRTEIQKCNISLKLCDSNQLENSKYQKKRKLKSSFENNVEFKKKGRKIVGKNECEINPERITLKKDNNRKKKIIGDLDVDKSHSTDLPNAQISKEEIDKKINNNNEYAVEESVCVRTALNDRNLQEPPNHKKQEWTRFKLNPIKEIINAGQQFKVDLCPNHLLKEVCRKSIIQRTEKKAVMTTYDLVHAVASNNKNIANFVAKHRNNFINNKRNIPENTRYYPEIPTNRGVLSNMLTFQSHYAVNINKQQANKRNHNRHLISKASRDNILISRNKEFNTNHLKKHKNNINKKSILNKMKFGLEQSIYTIENDFSFANRNNIPINLYSKPIEDSCERYDSIFNSVLENNFKTKYVGKSYTDDNSQPTIDNNKFQEIFNHEYRITYSIKSSKIYTEISENENDDKENSFIKLHNDFGLTYTKVIDEIHERDKEIEDLGRNISNELLDPIDLCEITYDKQKSIEDNNVNIDVKSNKDSTMNQFQKLDTETSKNITSHHFHTDEIYEVVRDTINYSENKETDKCIENVDKGIFNIQSRYTFVPKGMSPIFNNGYLKTKHNDVFNLDDEYYKDAIYENFAEKVVANAQIFEPKVQNVNEGNTNEGRTNNKINKENADLMFDTQSIKNAEVLNQVDCKFILTKLPGTTVTNNTKLNFLVLFDQHAVHERIRLENNLADYFDGTAWKSVNIDVISFKLPKDDTYFLHNHKDKLRNFGLEWIVEDNNISVSGIPEAILGKNPRQVDVVLKATKCLFAELIDALKNLKGNIPLYPQSIMNLVFSEACRYAIMFGEKLSKSECINLIKSLAECRTPFQCAHGRPVMAVIMQLKGEKPMYKINKNKVLEFNQKSKKT